jgi:hypothetical protein
MIKKTLIKKKSKKKKKTKANVFLLSIVGQDFIIHHLRHYRGLTV